MAGTNSQNAKGGKQKLTAPGAWPTERVVIALVIFALGLLIAIRYGFRGVNVLGVHAGIS
jgi:hypothetical protein